MEKYYAIKTWKKSTATNKVKILYNKESNQYIILMDSVFNVESDLMVEERVKNKEIPENIPTLRKELSTKNIIKDNKIVKTFIIGNLALTNLWNFISLKHDTGPGRLYVKTSNGWEYLNKTNIYNEIKEQKSNGKPMVMEIDDTEAQGYAKKYSEIVGEVEGVVEENLIGSLNDGQVGRPDKWQPLTYEIDGAKYNYPHNRIIFGAPGTGKSHKLEDETNAIFKEEISKYVTRVTFHPDYSYAHFVGTYKPVMVEKEDKDGERKREIEYNFIPGPFLTVYKEARKNSAENYVLIIEEINRANVAAVFGDVFQLLDRDAEKDNESKYAISASEDIKKWLKENGVTRDDALTLTIPKNMYIWATMNSADQGVYPMDTAFKRRWTFEYMDIDGDGKKEHEKYKVFVGQKDYNWNSLRRAINDTLLQANVNEDKCLGPFFVKDGTSKEEFASKVLMYLFEDVVKQKPSRVFNDKLKGFSSIYKTALGAKELKDIFVNDIVQKYDEYKSKSEPFPVKEDSQSLKEVAVTEDEGEQ